jgi:chromate transporter
MSTDATSSSPHPDVPPPTAVSLRDALGYWLKLGFVSFGGPAGQIAMMHDELVERRRWIGERRFLHALNYTMVLPGPEAQQLATYMGWLLHGTWGGILAGSLFVLPSLLILIALSWIYMAFGDVPAVAGVLYGIKPAVTAIVLLAAWRIGSRALRNPVLWTLAACAFIAIFLFGVPFPAIVIGAGIVGVIGAKVAPGKFSNGGGHQAVVAGSQPALIDDDTPLPSHARHRTRRMLLTLAIGIVLGGSVFLALVALFGFDATLTRMGAFFTKAAFLTFGGAYAVLPYVYQGGVETHGWLNAAQMIDGLALGETTPGPLIMVVAFVGFVGGWSQAALGPEALALAGFAGACVATFFTFLPSFLFILVGAPLVEATRNDIRLSGPLTAITAAVVGVILNLALFFAWHVLWPDGWNGPFDVPSALIGVAAFIAMFRFGAGVIPVIGACGLAGLALSVTGLAPF